MDANVLERAEELAKTIAGEARTIRDLNGVLKTLMKSALERMLGSELSVHLQDERAEAAASSVASEAKILALYAKEMTTRDIQQIVKELYGVDVSPALVSEITASLDEDVKAWRTRRLDNV